MRSILAVFTAIAFIVAAPAAQAGGRATCSAGYALSHDAQGRAICIRQDSVGGLRADADTGFRLRRPAQERRFGIFCGYPHRPSDTVFVGGSGYLIKDDVRRRQGC